MKLAFLGDIHANLKALETVLAEIEKQGVDKIIHTGDILGYCSDIKQTIELLKHHSISGVVGNHDLMAIKSLSLEDCVPKGRAAIEWTWSNIDSDEIEFVENLPKVLKMGDLLVFHATPSSVVKRVREEDSALDLSLELDRYSPDWRIGIHGHVHRQHIYEYKNERIELKLKGQGKFKLEQGSKYIICPGSVGVSRDYDYRTAYMILDQDVITMHRIYYDWRETRKSLAKSNLKTDLALSRTKVLTRRIWIKIKRIIYVSIKFTLGR